jgi:Phosphatidylinositol 5-phosphate phosphatase
MNLNYFTRIKVMLLLCSQVYWLGDLNYRITELDPWRVKDYIDSGNYLPLLKYDQLHQQHGSKNVFAGYQEGSITFRPTYKYDPGTDDWDSRYYIASGCYTTY